MKKEISDIDIDMILLWILENKSDIEAMDKINYLSFSFTSKFKLRQNNYKPDDIENGVSIG